ncbi:MFS transporter [Paraburkholderia sp. J67]|uniref:MFS transporter n=1 Tax=Paraburkholderia sp. J67 TaxID=2805435 RepID=UPI002ABE8886|nr:MFS transporter [Paraburkholderia sp. J67]
MNAKNSLLFISLLLTRLADQILLFIVPLIVFRMSGSVAWSGVSFFVESLPRYAAFPVCGVLCDRIPPVRLIHVSQILRALLCIAGAGGFLLFGGIGWVIGMSAGAGILTTQGFMAREAMLPQYFHQDEYRKILSYTQIADQLGTVIGPLAAGALLIVWSWQIIVAAAAAIFVLSDIMFSQWRKRCGDKEVLANRADGVFKPYLVATQHIVRIPGLLELIVLASGVNLVVGVTLATSAAMFSGVYAQSTSAYAWLQMGGAVATVVVLTFVAHVRLRAWVSGFVSYFLIVLGGLLMAWITHPLIYVAGFVLVTGFDKMFSVFIRSTRQRLIPPKDFGKTVGLIALLNNITQPLAGLFVGLFAGRLGAAMIIFILTCCMAGIGVCLAALQLKRPAWIANAE